MGTIISASRRTDIPAFYGEWLIRRLRAGSCEVTNPYNPIRRSVVPLDPERVEAIVFWTRYPESLWPHLDEIDRRGYAYYFLFTVLDYPRTIDRASPPLDKRIDAFRRVADRLGPKRVIWRYDPIVLTRGTGVDYHRRKFEDLCRVLAPYTSRVVVSLLDLYAKVRRRLKTIRDPELAIESHNPEEANVRALLGDLAVCARDAGLDITSCAGNLESAGPPVRPGACIDGRLISELTGSRREYPRDKNQRPNCNCVAGRDIGSYDTCVFDCLYCYAGRDPRVARENHRRHDPALPALLAPE